MKITKMKTKKVNGISTSKFIFHATIFASNLILHRPRSIDYFDMEEFYNSVKSHVILYGH